MPVIKGGKFRVMFANKFTDFSLLSLEEEVLTFIHNTCGQQNELKRNQAYSKTNESLCSACYVKIKEARWQKRQKQRILNKHNGEYELVSKYTKYQGRIELKHKKCGYSFGTTAYEFFNKGATCCYCSGSRIPKEEALNEFQEKFGDDYFLLTEVEFVSREVTIKHRTCGKETTKTLYHLLEQAVPCNFCGNRLNNIDELNEKLASVEQGEYIAVGDFKDFSTHADFKHIVCGQIYSVKPTFFLNGIGSTRCPKCFPNKLGRKRNLNHIKNTPFHG